ncbi:MAG: cytochrome c [Thiobacillus sp.]|nr:cytochrome c [Thiobacillus sp.]
MSVLIVCALLAACGERDSPGPAPQAANATLPNPADVLDALPPEARPYGLDVYTAHCAQCHGELGQGLAGNPALRGIAPAEMQQKLRDYRAGRIREDRAAKMAQAVARLSDAEIAAVSRYAGD